MNKEIDEIRKLFDRRLTEAGTTVYYGKVTATNEIMRTCTVDMDGIPYENVLLYAIEEPGLKGFVFIPAVNSQVLVRRIGDDRYAIEMFSVIDKVLLSIGEKVTLSITGTKTELTADEIIFNGGSLGGLVKIQELKDNLESLKTFVEAMHSALPSAFTAVGAAMSAAGANGATQYSGSMAGKTITIADMENTKIKH